MTPIIVAVKPATPQLVARPIAPPAPPPSVQPVVGVARVADPSVDREALPAIVVVPPELGAGTQTVASVPNELTEI